MFLALLFSLARRRRKILLFSGSFSYFCMFLERFPWFFKGHFPSSKKIPPTPKIFSSEYVEIFKKFQVYKVGDPIREDLIRETVHSVHFPSNQRVHSVRFRWFTTDLVVQIALKRTDWTDFPLIDRVFAQVRLSYFERYLFLGTKPVWGSRLRFFLNEAQ